MNSLIAERRAFLALLSALLAALLVFASCGGGGDDDDSGDSDEPVATDEQGDSDSDDEEDTEDEDGPTPEDGDDDEEDADEPTPEDEGDDDDDEEGGGGGEIDACALITPEEIEDITGLDVGQGENSDFDPFFSCNFSTETFDSVQVSVYHASEDEVEAYYELTQDAEEVDGIGERAQFGGLLNLLEVLQGEYDLSIGISAPGTIEDSETLDMSKELAAIVLDRLP
jgi:hypothetical protein